MIEHVTGFEMGVVPLPFVGGQNVTITQTSPRNGLYAASVSGVSSAQPQDGLKLPQTTAYSGDVAYSFSFNIAPQDAHFTLHVATQDTFYISLVFSRTSVTLYVNGVAVSAGSYTAHGAYVPVQINIVAGQSGYVGVKANHAYILEYSGQTINNTNNRYTDAYIYTNANGVTLLIDDVAVGGGGFIGQIAIVPLSLNFQPVPGALNIEPFGSSTNPLGDRNSATGYNIFYHFDVTINPQQTIAQALAPGGCIYEAFGGSPSVGSVFVINQNNVDTSDGALSAAKNNTPYGGELVAGDAFYISNPNPGSPSILYTPRYVYGQTVISAVQNATTAGFSLVTRASVKNGASGSVGAYINALSVELNMHSPNLSATTQTLTTFAEYNGHENAPINVVLAPMWR